VHDLLVKIHPADTAKIEATKRLVTEHFDLDALLRRLDAVAAAAVWRDAATTRSATPSGAMGAGSWLRGVVGRGGSRVAAVRRSIRGEGANEG
jgi:hypothetical protein